jgi:hypothetical protein
MDTMTGIIAMYPESEITVSLINLKRMADPFIIVFFISIVAVDC